MRKRKFGFLPVALALAGIFSLVFTACPGGNDDNRVTVIPVTSVSIGGYAAFKLEVNQHRVLTATVLPENATNRTVTWASSTPAVATVNPTTGRVDAVSATAGDGTTRITATAGGVSTYVTVTVIPPGQYIQVESISIGQGASMDVPVGQNRDLTITFNPAGATTQTVTWSGGNAYVGVDDDGRVTAIAVGYADITATSDSNEEAYAIIRINVVDPATYVDVESVEITPPGPHTLTLVTGTAAPTLELGATVLPPNASSPTVAWTSSNPTVATVTETGTVTAVAAGTATIRATAGGEYDEVTITVETAEIVLVGDPGTVDRAGLEIILGETMADLPADHFAAVGTAVMGSRDGYVFASEIEGNNAGLRILPADIAVLEVGDVLRARGRTTGTVDNSRLELRRLNAPATNVGGTQGVTPGSPYSIPEAFTFDRTLVAADIEHGLMIAPNTWPPGIRPGYFAFSIDDLTVFRPVIEIGYQVIDFNLATNADFQALEAGATITGHHAEVGSSRLTIDGGSAVVTISQQGGRSFLYLGNRAANSNGINITGTTPGNMIRVTGRTGADWPAANGRMELAGVTGETEVNPAAGGTFTMYGTITGAVRVQANSWVPTGGDPISEADRSALRSFYIYSIIVGTDLFQDAEDPADTVNFEEVEDFWPPAAVVTPAPVISITPASPTLTVGGTQQLDVNVTPAGADFGTITWTSSAAAVATVSTTGLVTAVGAGTATITAASSVAAIANATTVVTVNAPVDLLPWQWVPGDMGQDGNPATWTSTASGAWTTINGISWMRNGGANQVAVNATGIDLNNTLLVLGASNLPSGTVPANQRDTAADRHIPGAFNFSTPAMLYIDFHSTSADGAGRFQVQVNNTTGTAGSTVHAAPSTLFRVFNVRAAELYRHAVGSPAANAITPATPGTLRIPIALVAEGIPNQQHLATSTLSLRAEGGAQVTITRVRLEGFTAVEPTGVTITPAGNFSLAPNATRQLSAAPVPATTPWFARWSTSASAVATVNADGLVTAVAPGYADITATVGGETATVRVTVSVPDTGINIHWPAFQNALHNATVLAATRYIHNTTWEGITITGLPTSVTPADDVRWYFGATQLDTGATLNLQDQRTEVPQFRQTGIRTITVVVMVDDVPFSRHVNLTINP